VYSELPDGLAVAVPLFKPYEVCVVEISILATVKLLIDTLAVDVLPYSPVTVPQRFRVNF
jgi:hypothetical protein